MANWLRDHQASAQAGANIFRFPYPGGNWIEEKSRNGDLLELMDLAWRVAVLGIKVRDGKALTDDDEKLIDQVAEVL